MPKVSMHFWKLLKVFNREKGYKNSVRKAIMVAMEEEGNFLDIRNQNLLAFMTYTLFKIYLRFYRWFIRDIHFKRGVTKFMIYSLDLFTPADAKSAYAEIKTELVSIAERKPPEA